MNRRSQFKSETNHFYAFPFSLTIYSQTNSRSIFPEVDGIHGITFSSQSKCQQASIKSIATGGGRARARLLPQMLISGVVAAAAACAPTLWVEIKYMLRVGPPPPPLGLTQNGLSHFNCERNEVYFNFDSAGTE